MSDTTTEPVSPWDAQCTPLVTTRARGYDLDTVDDFLDLAADTLRATASGQPGPLTVQDVVEARLAPAPLGRVGYRRRDVDVLLDRIADTLEAAA